MTNTRPEDRELLDIQETSHVTHTPEATLRYWRHLGTTGPKSHLVGRRVMYRRVDVEAWLDEQYTASTNVT